MLGTHYKVLLIENDPEDIARVTHLLTDSQLASFAKGSSFQIACADRLSTGLEQLSTDEFDIVLLALRLPDSQGVDTLIRAKQHSPSIPIVILTGVKDEEIVVRALQLGAHGYLVKGQVDGQLLVYAIRLAIQRQQQLIALEASQLQQQQQQELQGLEHLVNVKTSVTAKLFGLSPLRQSLPDIFNEIVQQYSELMDLALEQRTYKVEYDISENLRTLAEQLGFLKAGPRDVVEIHTIALKPKTRDTTPAKAKAYVEEGRLMVLELMGYLTSYYRKYFIGLSKLNIAKNYQDLQQE